MKKHITLIQILLLSIFTHVPASYGQGVISPYTKARISEINDTVLTGDTLSLKSSRSEEKLNCYILVEEETVIENLAAEGIEINSITGNIVTASVPVSKIEDAVNIPGVKRIESGAPVSLSLDVARAETGADAVQAGTGIDMGYDGSGVIIGLVDSGLEYDHINFYDNDGNLRIKRIWQQNDDTGTPPDGFSYGSEYTTQNEIEALKYDTPTGTHATHVAGIAAGGYRGSDFYGIAPNADIVFVEFSDNQTSITDAISYIYSYAESVGKPAVINLSISSFVGARDGSSFFDRVADELQGSGNLMVGAASNYGSRKMHMSGVFSSSVDTVKSFMNGNYTLSNSDYIEAYGDKNSYLNVKVSLYDLASNTEIKTSPVVTTARYSEYRLTLTEGIIGEIDIYTETEYLSSRPHVFIEKKISNRNSGYALAIKFSGATGKSVHAWDYLEDFSSNNIAGWSDGDNACTVSEIGGTGKRIITAGAYCTKLFNQVTLGDISPTSSHGPTLDGRMKPEITAPGNAVISSYSDSPNIVNSSYYAPYLNAGGTTTVNGRTYYYGAMAGTSMSAPVVTGALALWLQARPELTPEEAREIIAETAREDEYTGNSDIPGNIWGYGKIDILGGIKECLKLNSTENIESENTESIKLYYSKQGENLNILFLNGSDETAVTVYNISGQAVMEKRYGQTAAGEIQSESLSCLPDGTYVVRCNTKTRQYRIKIIK